jgi:tetratricopeptide (TPR) repeat protein
MKKIIFLVALSVMMMSAKAQCGSIGAGMRALTQDKYAEAKVLFKKAELELKDAENKNDSLATKCYAKFYYGSGSAFLQEFHHQEGLDLVTKIFLLNKSESFLIKFLDFKSDNKSYKTKVITDLEAVANRQKEVGYDYFQSSDYETALGLFEKCIANKKRLGAEYLDLHAYQSASITASRLGNYEKALEYNEYLITNPTLKIGDFKNKQEKNYIRKAELLGSLKRTDEAIVVLDSAKVRFPENVNIELQQLRIFMDASDNNDAIVILESITKKVVDRDDLFLIMGQIYSEKGEVEKSFNAYKQALTINNQSVNALYGLGAFYVNKSNKDVQTLNSSGSTPEDEIKKTKIINERNKNFEKAILYFQKLLIIEPNDRSTLNALKKIYEIKEDKAKVEEINQKLMTE